MILRLFLLAALLIGLPGTAMATNPGEMLSDPALEERAREVSKKLRCVVCQNQSIDDSDAELARDMRVLVRERIANGDSNKEVLDYMVSRYGNFVLLKPPFNATTLALWIGPLVIFLIGVAGAVMFVRNRRIVATPSGHASLTDDERKRIDALLKGDGE